MLQHLLNFNIQTDANTLLLYVIATQMPLQPRLILDFDTKLVLSSEEYMKLAYSA